MGRAAWIAIALAAALVAAFAIASVVIFVGGESGDTGTGEITVPTTTQP